MLCPAWDQLWLALGGECCPNSPRNHLYPSVTSSWQALQEVAPQAGKSDGSQTPLTYCILSSHTVIFPHLKSCLLQSHLPTTTPSLFPFLF